MSESAFEQVKPEHADMLARLFERNAVAAVSEHFDPFPLTARQARGIALRQGEDAYYLASREGTALAMSMLRGFDEGYDVPSFGVFVDRFHHGQGIGRQLTVWTIEQARLRSCPAVRLTVYAENTPARRLYESLGFIELERQLAERADGATREKIVMRLELSRDVPGAELR